MAQMGAAGRLLGVQNKLSRGWSDRASVYKNGLGKPFLAFFRFGQPGDYTPQKTRVNEAKMKVGRVILGRKIPKKSALRAVRPSSLTDFFRDFSLIWGWGRVILGGQ